MPMAPISMRKLKEIFKTQIQLFTLPSKNSQKLICFSVNRVYLCHSCSHSWIASWLLDEKLSDETLQLAFFKTKPNLRARGTPYLIGLSSSKS